MRHRSERTREREREMEREREKGDSAEQPRENLDNELASGLKILVHEALQRN
jgi:hypothetical protein